MAAWREAMLESRKNNSYDAVPTALAPQMRQDSCPEPKAQDHGPGTQAQGHRSERLQISAKIFGISLDIIGGENEMRLTATEAFKYKLMIVYTSNYNIFPLICICNLEIMLRRYKSFF